MWQAFLHLDSLFGRERAEHVFSRQFIAFLRRFSGHPMHSRKALRLRLIQALTVPSGVPRRVEICAWV